MQISCSVPPPPCQTSPPPPTPSLPFLLPSFDYYICSNRPNGRNSFLGGAADEIQPKIWKGAARAEEQEVGEEEEAFKVSLSLFLLLLGGGDFPLWAFFFFLCEREVLSEKRRKQSIRNTICYVPVHKKNNLWRTKVPFSPLFALRDQNGDRRRMRGCRK